MYFRDLRFCFVFIIHNSFASIIENEVVKDREYGNGFSNPLGDLFASASLAEWHRNSFSKCVIKMVCHFVKKSRQGNGIVWLFATTFINVGCTDRSLVYSCFKLLYDLGNIMI